MTNKKPRYYQSYKTGKLDIVIAETENLLSHCILCPRNCKANRLNQETGICNSADKALVSSYGPHFGEESVLVGLRGSGTIFFTNCNLLCNFCQNFDISHFGNGKEVSDYELADMMLYLQDIGCHNVNFVTPTHVVPQILKGLKIAIEKGFSIPIVYNSSGYDKASTIKLLDGIFDIYMPDFKFWNEKFSLKCCNAPNYHLVAKKAIVEMYKQVGNLKTNDLGIATEGLIVRHLIMPNDVANSERIIDFIVEEISPNTFFNIMNQYRPYFKSSKIPLISRSITQVEYQDVINYAQKKGLKNLNF